jgi:hypothetical protein
MTRDLSRLSRPPFANHDKLVADIATETMTLGMGGNPGKVSGKWVLR